MWPAKPGEERAQRAADVEVIRQRFDKQFDHRVSEVDAIFIDLIKVGDLK